MGEEEHIWLPNLKKKGERMGQKNLADNTNARPIPQRRQLEMRNPAKTKESKQITTQKG
jgi:hypothetical protein